ncbi:hypothetical protein HanXRQr2_Chr01g0024021 [Helianthus annuus]|uniref:Transmembrane protein n=1 Tax=Helianthus annuus TaxID=4232 RepID=A0A251VQZ3_HELAN|nr:hypothetical protein HanXRQr2_Chr01g0024021 [Helianthus annuus]
MAGGSITGDSYIQNQRPKNRFRTTFFPFVSPTSSYLFLSLHFLFFMSFFPVIRPNPLLYLAINSSPSLILQSITWVLIINQHDFTFAIALFVDQMNC